MEWLHKVVWNPHSDHLGQELSMVCVVWSSSCHVLEHLWRNKPKSCECILQRWNSDCHIDLHGSAHLWWLPIVYDAQLMTWSTLLHGVWCWYWRSSCKLMLWDLEEHLTWHTIWGKVGHPFGEVSLPTQSYHQWSSSHHQLRFVIEWHWAHWIRLTSPPQSLIRATAW